MKISNKILAANPEAFAINNLHELKIEKYSAMENFAEVYKEFNSSDNSSKDSLYFRDISEKLIGIMERICKLGENAKYQLSSEILINSEPKDAKTLFVDCQIITSFINLSQIITKDTCDSLLQTMEKLDNILADLPDSPHSNIANKLLKSTANNIIGIKQYFIDEDDTISTDFISTKDSDTILEYVVPAKFDTFDNPDDVVDADKMRSMYDKIRKLELCIDISESDNEYLLSNFKSVKPYMVNVYQSKYKDQTYLSSPQTLMDHLIFLSRHSKALLSSINDLRAKLSNVIDEINYGSYEAKESATQFKDYLDNYVLSEINRWSEKMDANSVNPLIEMGLGYFYELSPDIITESTATKWLNDMNEYANTHNVIKTLTESINDYKNGETLLEASEEMKKLKEEMRKRKIEDKYELEKQKRLDRYERSKANKEAKAERRRNSASEGRTGSSSLAVLAQKLRAAPLTNDNIEKVYSALGKAGKAIAAAGAGAITGINPLLTATCYLLYKFVKEKKNGDPVKFAKERGRALNKIDTEIQRIESRLEYDSNLTPKERGDLADLAAKLESTKSKIYSVAAHTGGGVHR